MVLYFLVWLNYFLRLLLVGFEAVEYCSIIVQLFVACLLLLVAGLSVLKMHICLFL